MSTAAAQQEVLGEVSTEALMAEVQRRIECAKVPERRTIFIGPRQTTRAAEQRRSRERKPAMQAAAGFERTRRAGN